MLNIIWKVCDWDENKTYRSVGIHYPEHGLVEFDLDQAEVLLYDE